MKGWYMRKEILPEMFNYNKFPGPDFVRVSNLLKSDNYQFTVLEDYKEGLDATRFGQRFSELMLKYDYIVGDWSNDQLRLKGFYEDDKPNTRKIERISRLSEYLREYCAFGCAYFVLKNENPQVIIFEEETEPRRKRRRRSDNRKKPVHDRYTSANDKKDKGPKGQNKRSKSPKNGKDEDLVTFEKIKRRRSKPKMTEAMRDNQGFKKNQKKGTKPKQNKARNQNQGQKKTDGQHFTIRKKETNK